MSKTLIYLIAIFAMWMFFSFSRSSTAEKPTVKDFDAAGSGHGGTMVSTNKKPSTWKEADGRSGNF